MLNRARSIAAEHTKLNEQLAESFDAKTAKRIGELAPVTNALKEWDTANEVCSFFLGRYCQSNYGKAHVLCFSSF